MMTLLLGRRRAAVVVASLALAGHAAAAEPATAPAAASPQQQARAAQLFERGEVLYGEGRYEQAVKAFLEANRLAPHRATLFNVARCYENAGAPAKALRYYRLALEVTRDEARRADITRRVARLGQRTVNVLVASQPPGAEVTIDARPRPVAQRTPALLRLTPGEHLLLLRRAGYRLAAQRVEVAVGRAQRVDVTLEPTARAAAPRCLTAPPLTDPRSLHLHLHLMSVISLTTDRALAAGPGLQLHASYRNFVFGGDFLLFVTGERPRGAFSLPTGTSYDRESFRRWVVSGQGGWMHAWRALYLYATLNLGVIVDRAIFAGTEDDFVREKFAFTWGITGGLEVMATRWLSLGLTLRLGLAHGDRVDDDDPLAEADETHHFPLAALAGALTFHL